MAMTMDVKRNLRNRKSRAKADARGRRRADRQPDEKNLVAQAIQMATVDAKAREAEQRWAGVADFLAGCRMGLVVGIPDTIMAQVRLGQLEYVERQTAEHALAVIVSEMTAFYREMATRAGDIAATGARVTPEAVVGDVRALASRLRDEARFAKDAVKIDVL